MRPRSWPGTTPSWCPAASARAAWKARSARPATPASRRCPTWASAWGMQVATIEYARHVAGLANANSTEFDAATPHPVIALITEWKDSDGTIQTRSETSDLGGTMRLGAQSSDVASGTLAHEIYGNIVTERHRHRYEANVNYLDQLRKAGLVISALTQREQLTEIVELPREVHPWFIACSSTPSSSPPRGTAIRSSTPSSRRRSSTRRAASPHCPPLLPPEAPAPLPKAPSMKLCGFDAASTALLPHRRPLCHRVRAAADGRGRPPEGNHGGAGHPVHLQEQLRQGQPSSGTSFRARAARRAWRRCTPVTRRKVSQCWVFRPTISHRKPAAMRKLPTSAATPSECAFPCSPRAASRAARIAPLPRTRGPGRRSATMELPQVPARPERQGGGELRQFRGPGRSEDRPGDRAATETASLICDVFRCHIPICGNLTFFDDFGARIAGTLPIWH